ncbi:MAG TPA: prolyl oligopeptidase family serine peptidase, partial [Blastocatellia bacterium]|nr:prolyl oligopeptidase family serine peptidase [Blastocatellia bacterium]
IEKAYQDFFVGISLVGAKSPPREFHHATSHIHDFRWRNDSRLIYGLLRDPEYTAVVSISADDGELKQLLKIDGSLTNLEWQADGTAFVATRQSSLMPDQLVKVNLAGGTTIVLADPNAAFAEKDRPRIRFMRINNPLGGGIHGRLVLPNGYVQGRRYPLIFTTYLSGPEFLEGAVGDEFPILPFAASGFAVFVLDAANLNSRSDFGDLEFTLMMYKRPLDAMETVRQQLAAEGIIDPERCAITGLSYGSDIAVYALSKSKFFKAASISISGLDPIGYTLNSIAVEKILESSGLSSPEGSGIEPWKKVSLALNAAHVATPLMIQSSDSEALSSVQTFKALKRHGVPVDWYVYRGEGHLKSQPLNKYHVYRRNLDWMKFWLKDEVSADPDRQEQYMRWRAMKESFRTRTLSVGK